MLIKLIRTLVCLLLASCVTEKPEDPNLVDLTLQRYLKVSGSTDALSAIETRMIKGVWKDDRPYRGDPVFSEFTLVANADGRWRYNSEYEVYGVDTAGGWWMEEGYIRQDPSHEKSKLEFLVLPQSQLNIDGYFKDLRFGRKGKLNNHAMTGLFSDQDTTYFSLWFDEHSGYLAGIGHYWTLMDYRDVDGIRFPHRIEMSRKGGVTSLQIDTIIHNHTFSDSLLDRPTRLPMKTDVDS